MPIVYKITTTLDNPSVRSWPPQVEESEFYSKLQTKIVFKDNSYAKDKILRSDNIILPSLTETIEGKKVVRVLWFATEEEFESWVTENRLTDTSLLSALQEWATAYNLKITEEYYRVSDYSPNIAGLFS